MSWSETWLLLVAALAFIAISAAVNRSNSQISRLTSLYPAREGLAGTELRGQYLRLGHRATTHFARVILAPEGVQFCPPCICLWWRRSFFVPWIDVAVSGQRVTLAMLPELPVVVWPSLAERLSRGVLANGVEASG